MKNAGKTDPRNEAHAASEWFQEWAGLIGLFLAVVGIGLTVYQAWATQRHNRLMVQPHLDAVPYLEGVGQRNGLFLENSGLGPAIVTELVVQADGVTLDLLKAGQHRELVMVLSKRLKSMKGAEVCFKDTQPDTSFVVRADRPEPLLARTNAALIGDSCTPIFAAMLMSAPITIRIGYQSFSEDEFTKTRVIDLQKSYVDSVGRSRYAEWDPSR